VRKLRKYLGRISLELIQWLGLSLRNLSLFDPRARMKQDHYLVDFWKSLCGLRKITNFTPFFLSLAVSFSLVLPPLKFCNSSPKAWIFGLLDHRD
jgi:hypothetical protein